MKSSGQKNKLNSIELGIYYIPGIMLASRNSMVNNKHIPLPWERQLTNNLKCSKRYECGSKKDYDSNLDKRKVCPPTAGCIEADTYNWVCSTGNGLVLEEILLKEKSTFKSRGYALFSEQRRKAGTRV